MTQPTPIVPLYQGLNMVKNGGFAISTDANYAYKILKRISHVVKEWNKVFWSIFPCRSAYWPRSLWLAGNKFCSENSNWITAAKQVSVEGNGENWYNEIAWNWIVGPSVEDMDWKNSEMCTISWCGSSRFDAFFFSFLCFRFWNASQHLVPGWRIAFQKL